MREANENFKKVRKILKFTQNEFDEKLELTKQRTNSIENNRSHVDDEVLKKLKEKFNINPIFILFGEGEVFLNEDKTKTKIINGDNNVVTLGIGDKNKVTTNYKNNYNKKDNNYDGRINELIDMYKHLNPKDQEIAYHEIKLRYLKTEH